MCYLYAARLYSAINKNEIIEFTGKLMEAEITLQSEATRGQGDKCHIFSLLYGS